MPQAADVVTPLIRDIIASVEDRPSPESHAFLLYPVQAERADVRGSRAHDERIRLSVLV